MSKQVLKWWPVNEGLPADGSVVLAVDMAQAVRPAVKLAWYDAREAKWYLTTHGRYETGVTHWMMVPEPPEN